MPSLDRAARDYGNFSMDDENLTVVHLLLYGYDMQPPSAADAREWAAHYGLNERANHVVWIADKALLGPETRGMIPGVQVVDREFVLRFDSTGRQAPHDLWTELLPGIPSLLYEP